MAQTSGWLIIGITGFTRMPFLAAFNQAKLRSFVKPGDTLELTAALDHEGSGFARTKAEIRNDGKLACNAEITFRVVEFPNPEFRRHMEKAAATLAFPMESLANG
jgi:3-hydroxyacyl-[acyl-carrier-protein] dehydratase